ncbi:MAG: hypothetical protein NPIRA02_38650 [Nitrospirales bacterium]|nr:MAG: hypothetical protein NPIRA02_38650 [Nitrospirales bacterium]
MIVVASLRDRVLNTFRNPIKDKMIYFHIPKCGGSAYRQAIRSCYLTMDLRKFREIAELDPAASDSVIKLRKKSDLPPHITDESSIFEFRENLLLYYMSSSRVRFISGHFGFSNTIYEASRGNFAFVTVLRHPVERWISAYFYNRYKSSNHRKIDIDIEAYLDSELGRRQGREYAYFLGGVRAGIENEDAELIDRAKENLHKFDVIGFLEHPQHFIDRFEGRFGIRLRLNTTNESPVTKSSRDSILTDEIKAKIQKICTPDLEVYEYAVSNFLVGVK